jgi:hypothetical protein
MSNFKKKNYVKVGGMLEKKEKDDQGRAAYYIKLDDKVTVTVNGQKVTALNIQRPTDMYDRLLASGKISEAEYEEKMSQFEKDGKLSFVKFEVTAALDK